MLTSPPAGRFANRRLMDSVCPGMLQGFLGQPVAEVEQFFYFTPLVAIFERFFGLMIRFAEGMFRIADSFTDGLHCFHHSILPFLNRHFKRSLNNANSV